MKPHAIAMAAFLAIGLTSVGLADDLRTTERFSGTTVGFEFAGPYSNVTLSIAGPNNFEAKVFSKNGAPSVDLHQFGAVADGPYTYQLTASTGAVIAVAVPLNNGRDGETNTALKSVSASGTFNVKGGAIVARINATSSSRRDRR